MVATLSDTDVQQLISARHHSPRSVLGYHEIAASEGADGPPRCVVRVFEPDAAAVAVFWHDQDPSTAQPLQQVHGAGLFEGALAWRRPVVPYRLEVRYRDGSTHSRYDPYYFAIALRDLDLHLFGEGNHHGIYRVLGAHLEQREGIEGTRFAVWAPNAARVSVVGDFNLWDGRRHPMQALGSAGVWELFIPGVGLGALYKYEILSRHGQVLLKSDPYALQMQLRPNNAALVAKLDDYEWQDAAWIEQRERWNPFASAISVYEVHPGSWRRSWHRKPAFLTWDELAEQLIPYVVDLGYTHIELMGVAEHPFDGSWGYQVLGHYAPTARHGTPAQFRRFVDRCHQAGLGVFMDWVPAHFPRDAHGLVEFDGTHLYEHSDPRLGEHVDWGTKIFNYGRHEVRNFLVANALFWIEQYHIDGLRVDAVASMLYLDYSRNAGEWLPNQHGGRENLDAIGFLRQLNWTVGHYFPGVLTMAEESTAYPAVSVPVHLGGLGFHFKWNMGWMNDTLRYMEHDPVHRRHHHDLITFSFIYAFSENFLLPLSHDEVVHGKRALLDKMPGDEWQKFANYRLLLGYMTAYPGKKLLFMGGEFGQWNEWRDYEDLSWSVLEYPRHRQLRDWVRCLNHWYRASAQLHASEQSWAGLRWLEADNRDASVFAFLRQSSATDPRPLVVAFNCTPVPRPGYVLGVPGGGSYRKVLDSDAREFGGSQYCTRSELHSTAEPWREFPERIQIDLPPLAMVVWSPV